MGGFASSISPSARAAFVAAYAELRPEGGSMSEVQRLMANALGAREALRAAQVACDVDGRALLMGTGWQATGAAGGFTTWAHKGHNLHACTFKEAVDHTLRLAASAITPGVG